MAATIIPIEHIENYRKQTFCLLPEFRLQSEEMALIFINQREIITFWPIFSFPIPSLWVATAGDRPVPNDHDDPGHVTWRWKDNLLAQGHCYYGRILCHRNFFVSLDKLKYFYALSNNFGDYTQDHHHLYEDGQISRIAYLIYTAILNQGPMDTLGIKRAVNLVGKSGDQAFNRAIDFLQTDFKLLPVGISHVGGWRYAFIYDIVSRRFPGLAESSGKIKTNEARELLTLTYIKSVGAATAGNIKTLFRWEHRNLDSALDHLTMVGSLAQVMVLEKTRQYLAYILPDLI